jgi:hypothetical protein
MNQKVKSSFENLLSNLKRLKATKSKIYEQRISLYKDLMEGGNGGILPDGSEFRSLHFQDWTNKDFALLLLELNEIEFEPGNLIEEKKEVVEVISDAEVKKSWFGKLFSR